MKICAIEKEKKHLTRICMDSGEELLIDSDVCATENLNCGDELGSEAVKELLHKSEYERAKSRAFWYLDRMDYTEKGLYDKLIKAGFSKKASAEVLAKLTEIGVIDDERYAERFAEKCCENNISKREALHKMLIKGVPYELARQKLEETEINEEAQIAELLERKYTYKLTQENGTQKVYAALIRKGFSFSAVKAALKKYSEELEFCEEY